MLTLGLLSRDTTDVYLAEGLADAIASRLGQSGRLVVTSRTYVRRLRGVATLPPADLGRALNAAYLVSGTLLRSGARLHVTVELVRAATGRQAWSQEFDRGADDVLAIESNVAAAIVARVLGRPPPPLAALSSRPTKSGAAYDLYLRGRYLFNKQTRESLEQSLDYFHRAIALDSSFALAWVGIADSFFWLADDWVPPHEGYPQMREAARRALAIDSGLARAHTLLGSVYLFYEWDRAAAVRELHQAITLDPTDATAHYYYSYYLGTGTTAGLAELDTAQRLDPLNPSILAEFAGGLGDSGQPDEAIVVALRALALDSTQSLAWLSLGDAYLAKGRPRDAALAFESGRALRWVRASEGLVRAYVAEGRREEARAILADMEERSARQYVPAVFMAAAHATLGDGDRALAWLDRAVEDRSSWSSIIEGDPVFKPLHGDPRFERIVQRVHTLTVAPRE